MRQGNSTPASPHVALMGGALLALALVAYWPAIGAGRVWDDEAVFDNPLVASGSGLVSIWFRPWENPQEEHYWPVTYTSFWIERRLFGDSTRAHHANNILLHALNGLLLFLILSRWKIPGAAAAAILFVVHPIGVESVAWIIERKNTLNLFFLLLSLLAACPERKGVLRLWLCVILFIFSALSKSTTAPLPLALLAAMACANGPRAWVRDRIGQNLVILCAAAAAIILAVDLWAVHAAELRGGNAEYKIELAGRIQLAVRSIGFYAGKFVWPSTLFPLYPKWNPGTFTSIIYCLSALMVLGATFARFPKLRWPLLLVGVLLAPASGIMNFSFLRLSHTADRFAYAASAPAFAIVAVLLDAIQRRSRMRTHAWVLFALVVSCLAITTHAYARAYADNQSLFRRTLNFDPHNWGAHYNLANELFAAGKLQSALEHYSAALEAEPDNSSILNNLANTLARLGQFKEALSYYDRSLKLDPGNPRTLRNAAACARSAQNMKAEQRFRAELQRVTPQESKP